MEGNEHRTLGLVCEAVMVTEWALILLHGSVKIFPEAHVTQRIVGTTIIQHSTLTKSFMVFFVAVVVVWVFCF